MIPDAYWKIESEASRRIRLQRGRLMPGRATETFSATRQIETGIALAMLFGIRRVYRLAFPSAPAGVEFGYESDVSLAMWVARASNLSPEVRKIAERVPEIARAQANRLVDVGRGMVNAELSRVPAADRAVVVEAASDHMHVNPVKAGGEAVVSIKGIRRRFDRAAEMAVYSAFHDGMAAAATLPDVARAIPLWRDVAVGDAVTRGRPDGLYPEPHRHFQFSGYVNTMAEYRRLGIVPPLGPHCRCTLDPVDRAEAESLGYLAPNGTIDARAVNAHNGDRQRLVDAGIVPDRGWRRMMTVA